MTATFFVPPSCIVPFETAQRFFLFRCVVDTGYKLVYLKHTELFTPPFNPGYCTCPPLPSLFTGNFQHHLFFFCSPSPMFFPDIPACSSLCKPFIMTAIHNTSPSAGCYFPCKPVTASSSYPSPLPVSHTQPSLTPTFPVYSFSPICLSPV